MALDGAYLHIISRELEPLIGCHLDKIYQPAKDTLILSFRTRNGVKRLLMSAGAGSARVHITTTDPENPKSPPMFCMLLRKHLGGGRLQAIRQDALERILYLDFLAVNEMADLVTVTLSCEIMGRCSNIILISPSGRVIDAIKRVDDQMSRERPVLPGMQYTLPPRTERCCLLTAQQTDIYAALKPVEINVAKFLLTAFEGISPIVAREAAFYADKGRDLLMSQLSENEQDRLAFFLNRLAGMLSGRAGEFKFVALFDRNKTAKDFCFLDVYQYGALMVKHEFESASELLDSFYMQRDANNRMHQRADDLLKFLANATNRISKKIAIQKEELIACAQREEKRKMGDIISANLYKLGNNSMGTDYVELEDCFDETSPIVKIAVDTRLTASQNAQRYYAEYKKAQTAEKMLSELISKGEDELIYLDSVFDALTRSQTDDEVIELKLELASGGYLKATKFKNKTPKALPPLKYKSSDGFLILVGRNNIQNDRLTLKMSEKSDIWLHTQNITGSHVIIVTEGKEVPDNTLEQAAIIAAYNSKARTSSKVPVDYTQVRFVKKPSGSKPGMVIFTNNRTAIVDPDEALVDGLRVK